MLLQSSVVGRGMNVADFGRQTTVQAGTGTLGPRDASSSSMLARDGARSIHSIIDLASLRWTGWLCNSVGFPESAFVFDGADVTER